MIRSYIDHDNKLIFIHIPKTGGSSWCSVVTKKIKNLEPLEGHQPIYNPQIAPFVEDYTSLSFIRHPFDRFLSSLSHLKRLTPNDEYTDSFNRLIKRAATSDINQITHFIMENPEYYHGHATPSLFIPQSAFLCKNTQIICNIIVDMYHRPKINSLAQWYYKVDEIPHINYSTLNKREIWGKVTEKTKEILYRLYYADFYFFGYPRAYVPQDSGANDMSETT